MTKEYIRMVRIAVSNSTTQLISNPELKINELLLLLSYRDKSEEYLYRRRHRKFKEIRKYLVEKGNSPDEFLFPTGLLDRVLEYLNSHSIKFLLSDHRKKPEKASSVYFRKFGKQLSLRYYQELAVQACLDGHRGIIEMATGTGKTFVAAELTYQLKLPTLIVVPSINICKQFFEEFTGIFSESEVGMIGGGRKNKLKNITIITFQSISKMPKEFFERFKVLIFDESHHASAITLQEINKSHFDHIYYRFYLSATPYRNDGSDIALEGIIGPKKLFVYGFRQAVKDGFLVLPIFMLYDYIHSIGEDTLKNIPGYQSDYDKEYDCLIANNMEYNSKVAEVARKMVEKGRHVIIFVKLVSQGELLRSLIKKSVLLTGKERMSDSSQILSDFENKKFSVLIGTSVIGEGINLKSVDCGIMAGAGKAKSEVVQKIGRLLRPHPGKKSVFIVDFSHDNSKLNSKHAILRRNIYDKYNTKVYYIRDEEFAQGEMNFEDKDDQENLGL